MSLTPTPECFGKSWSATDTDCKGGYNAAYRDTTTGSNIQPACDWFHSCQSRTLTGRMLGRADAVTQPLVPLRRPGTPMPFTAPPTATTNLRPGTQASWPSGHTAQAPAVAGPAMGVPSAQPVASPQPVTVSMPSGGFRREHFAPHPFVYPYLSTPEPEHPDTSVGERFLWEVLRAAGKAVCQTAAHFLDITIFTRRPPRADTPPTA